MIQALEYRLAALWRDDPNEARLTIDLRILDQRCASSWDIFGAVDLDAASARPFILRRDGRIAFGAGQDSWRTNLREAELRVGAEFTVWFNEADAGTYKIVKIAALGAKRET